MIWSVNILILSFITLYIEINYYDKGIEAITPNAPNVGCLKKDFQQEFLLEMWENSRGTKTQNFCLRLIWEDQLSFQIEPTPCLKLYQIESMKANKWEWALKEEKALKSLS